MATEHVTYEFLANRAFFRRFWTRAALARERRIRTEMNRVARRSARQGR